MQISAAVAIRKKKRVAENKIIKMEDLRRKRYAVEKIAGRKKLRGSNGASSKWHKNEATASERTQRHPSCECLCRVCWSVPPGQTPLQVLVYANLLALQAITTARMKCSRVSLATVYELVAMNQKREN